MSEKEIHIPVMVKEVLNALEVKEGGLYLDVTLGAGGHSKEILKQGGKVLGIDQDQKMLGLSKRRLKSFSDFQYAQANFRDLDKVLQEKKIKKVDGILADLGISSVHYDSDERGFSFKDPKQPLDMRLDPDLQEVTAADLLNNLRADQLITLFNGVMSWGSTERVVGKVVAQREKKPFSSVGDFLELFGEKQGRVHPATKSFLALRMAVNSEEENLKEFLVKAFTALKKKGKLVIISFHSLEGALVKSFFKEKVKVGEAVLIYKNALSPSDLEISDNPRARSAKLRALEKIK